jgi:hypothetical protein
VTSTPITTPAAPAEQCEQQRLGQELATDVRPGRAQGAPQADLRAALQHRDHHDVGDAHAADQQGDRPEPQQQRGEGGVGGGLEVTVEFPRAAR